MNRQFSRVLLILAGAVTINLVAGTVLICGRRLRKDDKSKGQK